MQVLGYAVPGWGTGELWLDDERVLAHELPRPRRSPPPRATHASPLRDRVEAYFRGAADDFGDVVLDLDWCTPFQRSVAEALRSVPRGEVVTYRELAALAGYPGAQRAVGSFCAGNRFGLFVPCHRVVAADSLGSYGSLGVEYKRRLLALEGALAASGSSAAIDASSLTAAIDASGWRGRIYPAPTDVVGTSEVVAAPDVGGPSEVMGPLEVTGPSEVVGP